MKRILILVTIFIMAACSKPQKVLYQELSLTADVDEIKFWDYALTQTDVEREVNP